MKSAAILAASAAAVLGGAHATAPERKRLAANHQSVQRTREAFGRKAAPKGRGLQDGGAMSTPPTQPADAEEIMLDPEVSTDVTSPELGLGPELVPDVPAAMSMPTAAPVTDAPTTTTPTYYPTVDTDYPTYSPTAPEPPVAAASHRGAAGAVTLLVAGAAGVWATLN